MHPARGSESPSRSQLSNRKHHNLSSIAPGRHTDAELHAYAEQEAARVRASILAQAEQMKQVTRERGGHSRSPRYYSADEILRLARRLYLRTIHRLSWEAIAKEEERAGHERPDVKSVRTTVRDWARDLGIPLPPGKPGQPPKID
jgi:hypothetical protein